MKKPIVVRIVGSLFAIVLTPVLSSLMTPAATLLASTAALRQMTNSDAAYVEANAAMQLGALLSGAPGMLLLLVLLLIWGSLFFQRKK